MRSLYFVVFVLFSIKCVAQSNTFDKLIISYVKGHNSWGDPGIYSNGERFEFSRQKSGDYKIISFLKIEYSAGDDGGTFTKDTTEIFLNEFKIPKKIIDSLYNQLTSTKSNFTPAFIKPFLKTPSKQDILTISRKIGEHDWFEDYHGEDLTERLNPIRQFAKIDSFIVKNRPNPELFSITIDGWDSASILFVQNNDTTVFHMDFLQLLGQPISMKLKSDKSFPWQQYVNLEVNKTLQLILPITSVLRKRADISSLTEDYIKWYLNDFYTLSYR